MIQTPHTYAQWLDVLDALKEKRDDGGVLQAMQQGTLEWQSGVAERFTKAYVEAINTRMNASSDRFQLAMSRAGGREQPVVQALLDLRKEMAFLIRVSDVPAIPENQRKQYCQMIKDQADTMQSSLEDSAKKDRSGKLASIVRNHKVNVL